MVRNWHEPGPQDFRVRHEKARKKPSEELNFEKTQSTGDAGKPRAHPSLRLHFQRSKDSEDRDLGDPVLGQEDLRPLNFDTHPQVEQRGTQG